MFDRSKTPICVTLFVLLEGCSVTPLEHDIIMKCGRRGTILTPQELGMLYVQQSNFIYCGNSNNNY